MVIYPNSYIVIYPKVTWAGFEMPPESKWHAQTVIRPTGFSSGKDNVSKFHNTSKCYNALKFNVIPDSCFSRYTWFRYTWFRYTWFRYTRFHYARFRYARFRYAQFRYTRFHNTHILCYTWFRYTWLRYTRFQIGHFGVMPDSCLMLYPIPLYPILL